MSQKKPLTRHQILLPEGMFKELSQRHHGLPTAKIIRALLIHHINQLDAVARGRTAPAEHINIEIELEKMDDE